MNMKELEIQFAQWIEQVLPVEPPEEVAAFNFNMYGSPTTYDVEIVGCPTYDPDDSDWACEDIFMSEGPRFELPHAIVGNHWEQGLNAAIGFLKNYITKDSTGANCLRRSQAVGAGFVDGDLHLIWSANA